jgi:3'-phosphoadenosine 5'-phosphosulfate sulfotransferase (PAPS reductase)/FAD synthetase
VKKGNGRMGTDDVRTTGSTPQGGSASSSEPRKSALRILLAADREHRPVRTFALFSGGNDSAVLAHWAQPYIDGLVYIDTGTALPGVREFVEGFARRYEMRLLVYEAGDAFERLVLDPGPNMDRPLGFPGPGKHIYPYSRLKERQVDRLVREHKQERGDRVALLTGVRRAESQRRMGWAEPVNRQGAKVWVNPLLEWSDEDMRAYRERFRLPQSDVAALLHRSGECNCGAFAKPGEREMIAGLFPEFEAWLADLERKAEEAGALNCRWGKRPPRNYGPDQMRLDTAPGPMCVGCISDDESELAA